MECAKDMADAGDEVAIVWIANEFGRRWQAQVSSDLSALIKWVAICVTMQLHAYDEAPREPLPLVMHVPLIEGNIPVELQYLGALAFLADHYEPKLQADELARAAGWLAAKYGAMR